MARRSQQQWRELIDAQQSSGLNAAAFCNQHEVNAKYFSLRKNQLLKSQSSEFVRLQSEADSVVMDEEACKPPAKRSCIRVVEVEVDDESLIDTLTLILDRKLR